MVLMENRNQFYTSDNICQNNCKIGHSHTITAAQRLNTMIQLYIHSYIILCLTVTSTFWWNVTMDTITWWGQPMVVHCCTPQCYHGHSRSTDVSYITH